MTSRAVLGLLCLVAAAVAQPYCVQNTSTSIPPGVKGTGVISTCTSPLHPQWFGATITLSQTWIDIQDPKDGLVIDRLCIDDAYDTSPGGGVLQYQLIARNQLFLQVICFTVRLTPNPDSVTFTLEFSFADDKSNKCGTTWDTTVANYILNPFQSIADCPFEGLDGTGLEGWGVVDEQYIGFTSNGYWESPFGQDNHWTRTVCVAQNGLTYVNGTTPPQYLMIGENAGPTSTCYAGCCVLVTVNHDLATAFFQAPKSLLLADCPKGFDTNHLIIPNWVEGDPSPDQPSPAATQTSTSSHTPTSTLTPSLHPSASVPPSISSSVSVSATPYPQLPPPPATDLSLGAIGGIVGGCAAGSLFIGAAGAGTYFYRRMAAAEPDRQSLLRR